MKLSATVRSAGPSPRVAAARIAERLRAELERELQAASAVDQPMDAAARREALERAVRRVWGTTL